MAYHAIFSLWFTLPGKVGWAPLYQCTPAKSHCVVLCGIVCHVTLKPVQRTQSGSLLHFNLIIQLLENCLLSNSKSNGIGQLPLSLLYLLINIISRFHKFQLQIVACTPLAPPQCNSVKRNIARGTTDPGY